MSSGGGGIGGPSSNSNMNMDMNMNHGSPQQSGGSGYQQHQQHHQQHHHHQHHPHNHLHHQQAPPHHPHLQPLGRGGRYFTMPPSTSDSAAGSAFTPEMRDRQARGKDPYGSEDESDFAPGRLGSMGGGIGESPERAARREKAAAILDSPELLMMYARRSGDSIPATRMHFMAMMCGFDDNDEGDYRDERAAGGSWSPYRGSGGGGSSSRRGAAGRAPSGGGPGPSPGRGGR